ncbi:TAP42-like protein [Meredithblackwellia eburnea MCA 4105]
MSSNNNNDQDQDLTLGQILTRGINNASKVTNAPTSNDPQIQKLLQASLSDLTLSSSLIIRLGLLSPNETLADLSTRTLRCLLIPYLRGILTTLLKTTTSTARIDKLSQAKTFFAEYADKVERYEVVKDGEERERFKGPGHETKDPSRRRQAKIEQFKLEKELKGRLEQLARRRRARRSKLRSAAVVSAGSKEEEDDVDVDPFSLPSDLEDEDDEDEDSPEEDTHRATLLSLLQFYYLRSFSELSSIDMELELLNSSLRMSDLPSPGSHSDSRERKEDKDGEESWRLDKLPDKDTPLVDKNGKVLRPFTILPSSSSNASDALSTRLRLQSQVFGPSHRLPTMTIDELLDQEMAEGRFVQGGGPGGSKAIEEEKEERRGQGEEDNVEGWEREERELLKEREMDEWKDTHRKGEGNMHNRG